MTPNEFIDGVPAERRELMQAIHAAIVENDTSVEAVIEPMMGKEMILYKARGMMKYGLSSVQKYMSLHVLPMYMNPVIYDRYKQQLPSANFQKGCINFSGADEMPLPIIRQLIADCAPVDLVQIRNDQLAAKKKAKSSR